MQPVQPAWEPSWAAGGDGGDGLMLPSTEHHFGGRIDAAFGATRGAWAVAPEALGWKPAVPSPARVPRGYPNL